MSDEDNNFGGSWERSFMILFFYLSCWIAWRKKAALPCPQGVSFYRPVKALF